MAKPWLVSEPGGAGQNRAGGIAVTATAAPTVNCQVLVKVAAGAPLSEKMAVTVLSRIARPQGRTGL